MHSVHLERFKKDVKVIFFHEEVSLYFYWEQQILYRLGFTAKNKQSQRKTFPMNLNLKAVG